MVVESEKIDKNGAKIKTKTSIYKGGTFILLSFVILMGVIFTSFEAIAHQMNISE